MPAITPKNPQPKESGFLEETSSGEGSSTHTPNSTQPPQSTADENDGSSEDGEVSSGEMSSESGGENTEPGIHDLSDLFNGGPESLVKRGFQILNAQFAEIQKTALDLIVTIGEIEEPSQATWFQDDQGPMIYKSLGDYANTNFSVTTRVRVSDKADPQHELFPYSRYSSGGIMLRSTNGEQRNWIMYDYGFQDNAPGTQVKLTIGTVEAKTPNQDGSNSLSAHFVTNRDESEVRLAYAVF